MPSIPASAIVNVIPAVLAAGGSNLELNGLLLTNSPRVPVGTVQSFSSDEAVGDYFGPTAPETIWAQSYFLGFDNSELKPGALLISQYPSAPVAAYLRGGDVSGLTLTQLQAIAGTFSVTVDGVAKPIANVNLAAATSFSNAAALLTTQLNAAGVIVSYDAIAGAFVITSSTTGAASSIGYGSGVSAPGLGLTQATGAVLSQGAIAAVPGTAMAAIAAQTQNWVSLGTLFEPAAADAVLFAEWINSKGNRYLYAMQDTDGAAKVVPDTTSAGALIQAADLAGIVPIYEPSALNTAAFLMGAIASIDFSRTNGRTTLAFRSQSGLAAGVTSETVADNLIANGYNFYGAYATANDQFTFFYPGSITGDFLWIDSYVNQVWLNNSLQLAILSLLISAGSIPYNATGYGMIEAACADPINAALNFGAIRAGVTLSASQTAQVNADAGLKISDTLSQRGWYLQVQDATPQVRAQRGSPPCTLWYLDGQSIQHINLLSIQVQ